jgi:hypothetical protein
MPSERFANPNDLRYTSRLSFAIATEMAGTWYFLMKLQNPVSILIIELSLWSCLFKASFHESDESGRPQPTAATNKNASIEV